VPNDSLYDAGVNGNTLFGGPVFLSESPSIENGGFVVSNNKAITVPATGLYFVSLRVLTTNPSSEGQGEVALTLNSTAFDSAGPVSVGSGSLQYEIQRLVHLTAGNVVEATFTLTGKKFPVESTGTEISIYRVA